MSRMSDLPAVRPAELEPRRSGPLAESVIRARWGSHRAGRVRWTIDLLIAFLAADRPRVDPLRQEKAFVVRVLATLVIGALGTGVTIAAVAIAVAYLGGVR